MSAFNEIQAAKAFSRQAAVFDEIYSNDVIIRYKRERVRAHIETFLQPASRILELNAGTGEDAIYFSERGHFVHATDIAAGMQERLAQKVASHGVSASVTQERCSFTQLHTLTQQGPYDHIFSNFAGLNCTDELDTVLSSLPSLLTKQGTVTMVILPRFCLWEFMLLFRGKWKTALRRFSGKKGARSHIEGEYFRCWYYDPSYIIQRMQQDFELLALEGLCTIVPPSYLEGFADKYPRVFSCLRKLETRLRFAWPWRSIGDYYIISLKKK